jgi:hypothetical protein
MPRCVGVLKCGVVSAAKSARAAVLKAMVQGA